MKTETTNKPELSGLTAFDRKFYDTKEEFTYIGHGSLGGKAHGLAFIKDVLSSNLADEDHPGITVNVPRLSVLTTSVFDSFMEINHLHDIAYSGKPDNIIAYEFQKASLPAELLGDLFALISKVHTPLAIRSSSLLEDAMYEPFAGIYSTKMIPNNQFDADTRFHKLLEAIKFVYASTFFKKAKDYIKATHSKIEDEKMAVIIQEIVGQKYKDHFYPEISGVARSYNFYPMGRAKPEDGVVNLALGLGKTIVDGGISWAYSPSLPKAQPPFGSVKELLKQTQYKFWAVNMGKTPMYDPIKETEFMVELELQDAEKDGTLNHIASTYDAESDRLRPGVVSPGARAVNFAPILSYDMAPLNKLLKKLLRISAQSVDAPVEIEFAMTLNGEEALPARFGFLQVRPMVVSNEEVNISDEEFSSDKILLASDHVLGNGVNDMIKDVVYVKPQAFDAKNTARIALEIEEFNNKLQKNNKPYLLIGFGRWGSSDPWLGIPVNWGQISGAKVIVESMLPSMNVELSQGSHFFHNITSFQVLYFSLKAGKNDRINWSRLDNESIINETDFVKHVELSTPLVVKVDGRTGHGVILI